MNYRVAESSTTTPLQGNPAHSKSGAANQQFVSRIPFLNAEEKNKWMNIGVHVLIWLAIFIFPYIFNPDYDPQALRERGPKLSFRDLNTVTKVFWLGLFYLNAFVLVPVLIYKRRFVVYLLFLFGLFIMIMFMHGLCFQILMEGRPFNLFRSSTFNLAPFAFTILLSIAYQSIADHIRTERLMAEKQSENLKTELSFLRSQISPHFLFNVLNNIVALVRIKSEELEPTIMKLSSLMQYMLYETDEERGLLKTEAEYLRNYIDLQKQRFGSELTVNIRYDVKEDWHTIEPMLLIPFVENAFKHGTGLLQYPEIHIELSVVNNQLSFTVKNKYEESISIKDKTSGIGLANVKRRLELLYPDRHRLTIDNRNGWFLVHLNINLN
ncbi:histidine kinase [Segetibacter sp. 3557_3]|uniref:sensor histidine kinase n=1 Tax=Segetibacter sp. 3557_3 TaxID=2547429 RepID=UPI001058D59A|nr:histidine kinase [Segetibacter sp. 3557_3]TDH18479.1 histidine kinase [Segetibacter sp. 3557_3]